MKAKLLKFISLICVLVLTFGLAACQKNNNTSQSGQSTGAAAGTTVAMANTQETSVSNLTESGFPIVKEQITLKMFGRKSALHGDWQDMPVLKEYEKMTNIKVEYETAPDEGYDEKKNLLFASNDLPDAFIRAGLTSNDIAKCSVNGTLIPLEGLIDKYAPNLTNLFRQYPDAKKSLVAGDGHIYALPTLVTLNAARTPYKPFVRKTWLEKVNKEIPVTLDDLENVLKAFKDQDFNGNGKIDEVPMTAGNFQSLIEILAGSWGFGKQLGYYIKIDGSKVSIWVTDDRFKEVLMYINKLWKEDLIDKELFTQTTATYTAKLNSGLAGIFYTQAPDFPGLEDLTGMAPYKGPYGDQLVSIANPVSRDLGTFAITSINKYPEATMRWIDYFYGDEGSIFLRYGIEGQTYKKQPDGSVEYTDDILKDSRGLSIAIGQFTIWPGGGAPHWINDKNSTAINSKATQQAQQVIEPYLPKMVYGPPQFDEATSERVLAIMADVTKYYEETASKFITGDLSFDKWGEYVSTMQKLGITELEGIYQKAFDSMQE